MKKILLAYTDGGYLATGITGWGVALYELDLEQKDPDGIGLLGFPVPKKADREVMSADKAIYLPERKNKNYKILRKWEQCGGLVGGTNNVGETLAIKRALEIGIDNKDTHHLIIFSDSKYALLCMTTHVDKWAAMNWYKLDGQRPKNLELWKQILDLKKKLGTFSAIWVRGHSNNTGNEKADELATSGMGRIQNVTNGELSIMTDLELVELNLDKEELKEIPEAEKPKKSKKIAYDRLLTKYSWYFQSGKPLHTFQGRTVYAAGNHGPEDTKIRADISDTSISITYLKTPDPALEMIHSNYVELPPYAMPKMVIGKLANILAPKEYQALGRKDASNIYQLPNHETFNLLSTSHKVLTNIEHAPRVSWKLFDAIDKWADMVELWKDGKTTEGLTAYDITEHFYDKSNSKVTLLDSFSTADKVVKVKAGDMTIPLTVNIDMPDRNMFNACSDKDPTVHILTLVTSSTKIANKKGVHVHKLAYAVVLTRGDGDFILWTAPARSVIFQK